MSRGKIDLDATLGRLDIDDIPPSLTKEEKQATVRDLLKSRSGVYHEAAAETEGMAAGARIFEAFKKEIAEPIGMEDFSLDDCEYAYEETKSRHPAYAFRMTAKDMARFGLLYMRKGNWNGRQIIPADWVEKSTTAYSSVSEEMGVGYGYMWNVVKPGSAFSKMLFDGQGAFYHTGMGIHTLSVLPSQKLVYVYRYDTDGDFQDPGEATIRLVAMTMNARCRNDVSGGEKEIRGAKGPAQRCSGRVQRIALLAGQS